MTSKVTINNPSNLNLYLFLCMCICICMHVLGGALNS